MNNEIGRKLTSLTLMTIMLAGGMVIAAPSMVPEAAAAGQLFVSAENANFNNFFAGMQIVEIIVKDPNANQTDEAQPEPTVKVDEHLLRMAQATDGYWYAYIGDSTNVAAAHADNLDGSTNNLEFGYKIIGASVPSAVLDSTGFSSAATSYHTANIVEGAPSLSKVLQTTGLVSSASPLISIGQIGIDAAKWPVIQTFDFTIETFEVKLEQPGADEIVVLTHDNDDIDDYASIVLDRNAATNGAYIHATITDQALNIDPTTEDVVMFNVTSGSEGVSFKHNADSGSGGTYVAFDNSFDDNGKLIIDYDANGTTPILIDGTSADDLTADKYLIFWETAENSGVFVNTDDADVSNLTVTTDATMRGQTATFDYNDSAQSFVVAHDFATIEMDVASVGDEWNSGEEMTIRLHDQDLNLNTMADEDLTVAGGTLVPSIQIGSPLSITTAATVTDASGAVTINDDDANVDGANPAAFSKIASVDATALVSHTVLTIDTKITAADWDIFLAYDGTEYLNYHLTALTTDVDSIVIGDGTDIDEYATAVGSSDADLTAQDYEPITFTADPAGTADTTVVVTFTVEDILITNATAPFYVDFFSLSDSVNHAIYRVELEETGDNTGIFEGSAEYVMLNQFNNVVGTFAAANPTQDDVDMIVHLDMTDEDSIRVNYLDLGADGVSTQIADQQAAPTHSGSADLDLDSYKIADTVVVTINDQDLNTNSELIDVYTTTDGSANAADFVGVNGSDYVMDITFDDITWNGLYAQGFTLVETGIATGVFQGSFQVPENFDDNKNGTIDEPVTGTDIEVNYNDHRDGSGNTIEVGDGASIRANTGSVSFDRTVYPVHYAASIFKEHATSNGGTVQYLPVGSVVVHIQIDDPDYDISAFGEDSVATAAGDVVSVKISRGSLTSSELMPTASVSILETAPSSGIFEYDLTLASGVIASDGATGNFASDAVINQGDIITVTYTDPQDASGKSQTVTDSSSFDLRNGTLQADKSVYLIGSDMILTLIEPDFDLDNDETESYTLDLIEWDSDAAETSMGPKGITGAPAAFDPEPSEFRETGDSTGIFQVVIEIPDTLNSNLLDRGEKIDLEYTDWGPAGADYVGQEDEDIGLTVYTSNFGATIELDQKVYTWTDKVYITIVAPDHNFDSGLVDEIGNTGNDPVKVSTRGHQLDQYKLVESGADTGIFIGEVTLAGFTHDADGDGTDDVTTITAGYSGSGPTEGKLVTSDNDGLTVSFEFSEDETVVGSALIRWNIGEVQWLEASYPASGTGVVRVIDADMNLDPESVDNFAVDAWSDSDAGGIDLTITETNEATGIFEGTVFFTTANDSSGHRLRVSEGDTVTAEYEDNTLPEPYTTADELDITATTLIGTIVPPLERAPAANLRTVDAFGNSLNSVSVDQQVQISAELANGQDREQSFAYLVQIQDGDGVTVSLAWITGSLSSGQSFSPALSWIPTESGSYTATAFVWESVDNPTALSPPVSTTITVQ